MNILQRKLRNYIKDDSHTINVIIIMDFRDDVFQGRQ
jgi:hypothetical protein